MSCEIRREQDEWACRKCARRWPVTETVDCIEPIGRNVPFTETETKLFSLFYVGEDTSIAKLFDRLDATNNVVDPREKQHWLGPHITRMNRKLVDHGYVIEPGEGRRTYTLKRI